MNEWLHALRLRLRALGRRGQLDRDLEDELAFHMEMRRAAGEPKAPFGNATATREKLRDTWALAWEDAWRELTQSVRILRRSPGHTAAVIVLLALGIGGNAAMFSVYNALFVRELPVPEPARLAVLNPYWSLPGLESFRRAQTSFSGIFGTGSLTSTSYSTASGEQLSRVSGGIVTGNYFQVLGVTAQLGRLLTPEDDQAGDPRTVAVISDGFWTRQFHRDSSILGTRIYLSGTPFTIVGVAQQSYRDDLPGRARDLWVPMNTQPLANPSGDVRYQQGWRWLSVMGRLKSGVSIEQAMAEARVINAQMESETNTSRRRFTVGPFETGRSGFPGYRRSLSTQLQILAITVGIMLLLVCLNAATLLLVRGTARGREIAVRQALGCGRARLVCQLFLEGLLLTAAGAAIGLFFAPHVARALLSLQPTSDIVNPELIFDMPMIAFGLGISLVTAAACTLIPALRVSRVQIEPALRSASRGTTGSAATRRTIRALVALQTALSVVLVAMSFLFAQSLYRLRSVDGGFERIRGITATLDARVAGYNDPAAQYRLAQRLIDRLSVLPGVESASLALCSVLMGCSRMAPIEMEGAAASPGDPSIWLNSVTPAYFQTTGIHIEIGRAFDPADRAGAPRVAVVTESLARSYFPEGDAIGRRFTPLSARGVPNEPIEIIGIIRDVRFVSPRDKPIRMAFLSYDQFPGEYSYLQVRTKSAAAPLVNSVRQAIFEVEPRLYMRGPNTLPDTLAMNLSRETLLARASLLFGGIALFLACFGIYGVVSYLVAAGRSEIGIRLAIGAQPGTVMRQVIRDALLTVSPGIVLGLGAAWAGGQFIESLLFGVTRQDLLTNFAVALVLLGTTIIAAWLPARRASRIDPLEALRCE
ncbi:MAG: ABC transporter permease [Acidobacteria bacterium]|nr:ABC transporter permease [Acidobacteriota bacterium]